jgi:hypothetical protein
MKCSSQLTRGDVWCRLIPQGQGVPEIITAPEAGVKGSYFENSLLVMRELHGIKCTAQANLFIYLFSVILHKYPPAITRKS